MSTSLLPLAELFGMGAPELIILLVVVMVLFGGKKLPELAKGLGKAKREFKKASEEDDEDEAPKAKSAEAKKADSATPPSPGAN